MTGRWMHRIAIAAVALAWAGLAQAQGSAAQEQPAQGSTQGGAGMQGGGMQGGAGMQGGGMHGGAGMQGMQGGMMQGQAGGSQKLGSGLTKALQQLHASNQAEIKLGQEASQRAQNPQVQQFAQMIVQQHQQLDQQLEQVAQEHGVQLQAGPYQKTLKSEQGTAQSLSKKQGIAFDKAYMDQMVKRHDQDVGQVHDAAVQAAKNRQPQVAQALGQAEAALIEHDAMAHTVQHELQQAGKSQQRQGRSGSQLPRRP